MSCAIACADTIHQGQFHALASYSSPIIFNNTCWSWSEVAAFFLAGGARAYVGTLWAIESWVRKIDATKIPEIRKNSIRILRLLVRELLTHFPSAASIEVEKNVKNQVPDFERRDIPDDSQELPAQAVQRSMECPVEFRHIGRPAP